MQLALDPRFYAIVPVWLWPVLFLRLWAVHVWCVETGRTVLFTVTCDARLHLRHTDDGPQAFSAWRHHMQGAATHQLYLDNADGAADVNPIIIWVARSLEASGYLTCWVWVRIVLRLVPAPQDSS